MFYVQRTRFVSKLSQTFVNVRLKSTAHVQSTKFTDHESKTEVDFSRIFSGSKIGTFFQEPPSLENQYTGDSVLKAYLRRHIPQEASSGDSNWVSRPIRGRGRGRGRGATSRGRGRHSRRSRGRGRSQVSTSETMDAISERRNLARDQVMAMNTDTVRDLMLMAAEIYSSMVLDLIQRRDRPGGGYHPQPTPGGPSWCTCGRCRQMPTEAEKVCCGKSPDNCVSRTPVFKCFEGDLERFGQRVATEINELGLQCEREPPRVEHYDAWGRRVDRLITSPAWRKQHDVAAEEGLIAIAYERQFKEWSRLYQMAKLYLFSPSSGLYSCPLAMTDGAAKIIEGISKDYPWLKNGPYQHLVSRDPGQFWTSGQWMTERGGGSDVASGTETYAVAQGDGSYHLHGYKWFSSATDSDMTFTLARVVDSEGQFVKGTKGLSLFYLETRDKNGDTNGIHIQKLKNKLGTRQLPTAELLLDGAVAFKVSKEGRGVAGISNMLTISRLHNSMSSASIMRRILNLARDYATRRCAFGNLLKDYPLHIQTLARLEVEARAATLLTLEIARYLGREDNGIATEQDQMMIRLLTPLAKLYTGKQAMSVVSEGIESFGGQGYIEDTGIPVMLRDAQVLTIWEGTTNILSLDVLRAVIKTQGKVLMAFKSDIDEKLKAAESQTQLTDDVNRVRTALDNVIEFAVQNQDKMELATRDFSFSLARIYIGALLLDHAVGCGMRPTDIYMGKRWCEKDLCLVLTNHGSQQYDDAVKQQDFSLVFEDYTQTDRL